MIQSLLIPSITICLAELGDKSQLSILLLASKTKNHRALLLGVMLAFFIVDGSAILLGSLVTTLIPSQVLGILTGVIFIIFGLLALRKQTGDEELKITNHHVFSAAFSMIFLAEWGDKTQIASALFATKYSPYLVLVGVMLAMLFLSIIAIFIGKIIISRVDKNLVTKISSGIFITLGIAALAFSK